MTSTRAIIEVGWNNVRGGCPDKANCPDHGDCYPLALAIYDTNGRFKEVRGFHVWSCLEPEAAANLRDHIIENEVQDMEIAFQLNSTLDESMREQA